MYPHQQYNHHVPSFNLQQQQQPYYSENPFLFSFATATSDSSLHPPGTDPLGNSNPYSSSYVAAQSTDSQNWIVKQAEPIRYDLAVGSSHETSAASASFASTWNATWSHQSYATDTTVMLPNRTKITKPLRCDICKIDCNSKDVYEKHLSGKKHKRNLQVQINPTIAFVPESSQANVQSYQSSIQGQELTGSVSKELVPKSGGASADSAKVCTICNVVCNSQDVYNKHLYGKKHAAQVALISSNGIGPYVAEFKRRGIGPWKKAPKKIKVAQSAWCEVCKINCNSRDVYVTHLSGKKHLKNLEKLSAPKIEAGTSATATSANALQGTANPVIGPQEKPNTSKSKKPKASELDMEMKKRKVLEGGAAVEAVKLCSLCNVVCNSQIVFDAHIVGHKHLAMLKKAGSSIA